MRSAALDELVRAGPAALSLRAVAREVGIAVSALYRYFPSRDELLTDLIVRAFDDQADAVQEAADAAAGPVEALRAALLAYRAWSLTHPEQFALLYGAPVADYAAPPEQTVRAGARVGDLLVQLLEAAHTEGLVPPEVVGERARRLRPSTAEQLQALADRRGYPLPPAAVALGTDLLVRMHGFVVMEVFGQLRPLTPDATSYAEETLDGELARLVGRTPP